MHEMQHAWSKSSSRYWHGSTQCPCTSVGDHGRNAMVEMSDCMVVHANAWQLIGVDLVSICSVFYKYFCNLNARFTAIFLKITLIPHLLMFCKNRR